MVVNKEDKMLDQGDEMQQWKNETFLSSLPIGQKVQIF